MNLSNSPVTSFILNQHEFFIKRDDLLNNSFNGNKARKLYYYLSNDFPNVDTIVSYGGNQSNLMYALSCLAKLKNWKFIYYTKNLSKQAQTIINNNFNLSINNGMKIICLQDKFEQFISNYKPYCSELFIHQGGHQPEAESGLKILANEISHWAIEKGFHDLNIFLPSGTGTSAFFLQKHLPQYKVFTTNCVGTSQYLIKQISALNDNNYISPTILDNNQYQFAIPDLNLLETISKVEKFSNIQFDRIYDPVGWRILLNNLCKITEPILYIHCGGLTGNNSMNLRYTYLQKKQSNKP